MTRHRARKCGFIFFAILIAAGSLLVFPGHADAQISYCGPVSYDYTRHLKWDMDYTDKTGKRDVRIKEEKIIMSGEWYICLGGMEIGNTGMFDGEAMQEDLAFSRIETWLDQRIHSDGVAGRRENNSSSPEGRQSGMRGSMILDCPEGQKVPGKPCAYTLNLFAGLSYVYTTDQETFHPPEKFTASLPQIFNRHLVLEDQPLQDTWSVSGQIRRDIKVEEHSDDCEMVLRQPHIDACSYEEWEDVRWSLDRKGSPCDARITRFSGDVTINGRAAGKGTINLANGDVIQTGRQSRLEVKLGDGSVMRLGSKTKLDIEPCRVVGPEITSRVRWRIWGGKAYAIINELVGKETNFEIRTGTAVVGVRGELPKPEMNLMAFLSGLLPTAGDAEAADLPEDFSTLGSRVASTVFSVETIPEEKVVVEVFKGSVMVRDTTGSRRILVKAGQSVESWEDGSPFEDVVITNAPES
jgi:hypothetical protein